MPSPALNRELSLISRTQCDSFDTLFRSKKTRFFTPTTHTDPTFTVAPLRPVSHSQSAVSTVF